MAKAIITLEDTEDGEVNVKLEFGDGGAKDDSGAHHLALDALTYVTKQCTEQEPEM